MPINPDNIPPSLKAIDQWVLWRTESRDGDKPTKVPYHMENRKAKANDRNTWTTFQIAYGRYSQGGFDGIGFEFHADDPFCGIDLDGCRDPETGKVSEWAREIIIGLNSYAEISPSQTGVKIWVRGKSPLSGGKKRDLASVERVCDKSPAIEIYDSGRYFAVTGQRLTGPIECEPRQEQLDELAKRFWPPEPPRRRQPKATGDVVARARKYLTRIPPAISGQGGHNATFYAACVLVLGFGLDRNDALSLLGEWNGGCNPPWSDRELEHKIDQAMKQDGERNYLRDARPDQWDSIQVPGFAPPPKRDLKFMTMGDAAKNYIQRVRDGEAELTPIGLPELDWAIGGGVEFGEVILLAARPNHGKSVCGLQCAYHWAAMGIPTLFISEEMSERALAKRALQFTSEMPEEEWCEGSADILEHDLEAFASRDGCYIVESVGTAASAIEHIETAVRDLGVRACVVDYVQLLKSEGKSRYEQVSATSIAMRQLATRLKIILVLLCQLNREIEKRPKFRPFLSDIKESGQLEQDADVVVFLCWPHRLNPSEDPHVYQFWIAKNRNRSINEPMVTCRFEPSRQRLVAPKIKEHPNYNPDFDSFGPDF